MSQYEPEEQSESYNLTISEAHNLLRKFRNDPSYAPLNNLLNSLLTYVDSAPVKIVAAHMNPELYPIALRLRHNDFAHYLRYEHNDAFRTAARTRERIYALSSVYSTVLRRIDSLDTEFRAYIGRLGGLERIDLDNLPLPADKIRIAFCQDSLNYYEADDIFSGLPDTLWRISTTERTKLIAAEGPELRKLVSVLASKAKSRALNRFYLTFLRTFAECILDSDGAESAWQLVHNDQVFSEAINRGLYAVEYPDRLSKSEQDLMNRI